MHDECENGKKDAKEGNKGTKVIDLKWKKEQTGPIKVISLEDKMKDKNIYVRSPITEVCMTEIVDGLPINIDHLFRAFLGYFEVGMSSAEGRRGEVILLEKCQSYPRKRACLAH